jgi:hypothetical protein
MKRPELLPPAGSLKNRRCAFASGADAAQAGQPRYSLRVRNFMARSRRILNIGLRQWRETEAQSSFQRLNVQLAQRFAANSPKCQRYADAMRRLIQTKFR